MKSSHSSGTAVTTAAAGQHLSCRHSVTGSDSTTWYYAENSIGQRGYVPASSVLTCIGGTKGTKNAKVTNNNTILYASTSTTSTKVLEGIGVGTRMVINSQSTVSGTVWYRVGLLLGTTKYTGYMPASSVTVINGTPEETANAPASISDSLDAKLYRMCGIPDLNKRLTKTFPGGGAAGDSYMVNLWGYDKGLPITGNDGNRHFGVRFAFSYTDGTTGEFFTDFGADGTGWQFLGDVYVAKKAYSSISVSICFDHQAGYAYFDGFALYRENYSQGYAYNDDGNVESVTDIRNEQTSFAYNTNQDLTGITDPKGNQLTITYDNSHRPTKVKSALNVQTLMTYDSHGNVTKQGNANPSDQTKGTWVTSAMTSDGNHVSTVTSPDGKTTRYYWDAKDRLTSVKDPRSNTVSYTYDAFGRVTEKNWNEGDSSQYKTIYTYATPSNTNNRSLLVSRVMNGGKSTDYTYDDNGNIKTIKDVTANKTRSYVYDKRNQVTRENDPFLNKTILYTYDLGGNLTTIKEYAYTTGTPGTPTKTINISFHLVRGARGATEPLHPRCARAFLMVL